ncbi:hypothetical protein ACFY5J_12635 [Peribacillus butanolivorans]|uniref:hypothetical protein n=1 Tax=Peribacillus butanolivorans TaxID=421767 RepID=UPI0036B2C13B
MDIVYETLNKLKQAVCHEFHPSAILYSEPGVPLHTSAISTQSEGTWDNPIHVPQGKLLG